MSDETPVPTTEVPTTEVPATVEYLFDIDTLVTDHDRLLQKEAEDRAIASTVENPDPVALKAKLVEWASRGFPGAYPVFSVTLNPPAVCSDGVARDKHEYFTFLTGAPIWAKLTALSEKLKGMHLEYSAEGNTFTIHIFKD